MRAKRLGALACALFAVSLSATTVFAKDWIIIAPSAPGGGWDQTGRSMQKVLQQDNLARGVQVINIPGAGGTIGLTQFVMQYKNRNDVLLLSGFGTVGGILMQRPAFTMKDVLPIARLTAEYSAVVVPASSPIRSLGELIEAMKKDPSKVSIAGGSVGTADHLVAALIGKSAGISARQVNYVAFAGGGEAMAAIMGGKVTAGVSGYGELMGQIAAGSLRLLGITAEQRLPGSDAPTLREQGVDVVVQNWRMVAAAPGISDAERAEIETMIDKMVKSQGWKDVLKQYGWSDAYLPGAAFQKFIDSEFERTGSFLKEVGLTQ